MRDYANYQDIQVQRGDFQRPAGADMAPTSPHAAEFSALMDGLALTPSAPPAGWAVAQVIRAPVQAFREGMAEVAAPLPANASSVELMQGMLEKQNHLNGLRVLTNLSTALLKTTRKDLETVLNSK